MKRPEMPAIATEESFNVRPGGEEGVASSAGILPVLSRQIESAGWWERPADDHLLNL